MTAVSIILTVSILLASCGGGAGAASTPLLTPESTPEVLITPPPTPSESTPSETPTDTPAESSKPEESNSGEGPDNEIDYEFTYSFSNDINGSAAGTISYTTEHSGQFYAYWDSEAPADSKWGTPGELFYEYEPFASGYAALGSELVLNIHEWAVIPEGATRVLLCHGSAKNTVYVYDLPEEKIFNRGELLYTFGSISDAHLGNRYGSPQTSVDSLTRALDLLAKHGVSLVAISGDITVNGTETEFQMYKNIVDKFCEKNPNVNVYSTNGNHDIPGVLNLWPKYGVGSDNYTGELEIKRYGDNQLDYTVSVGNDVFVFLTQRSQHYNNTSRRIITPEQMEWLSERFEENKDKRIYFYFHTFLNDENGDASNGYYEYDLPLCEGAPDDIELRALLRKHKNVIMFTGHSHWIFSMQDVFDAGEGRYNYNANIANGGGEYGVFVHNPSVSEPRGLTGNNSNRDELHGKRSEGYVAYVYEDCVVLYAYDFMNDRLLSKYSYIIDTSEKDKVTVEDINNSVWGFTSTDTVGTIVIDDLNAYISIAKNGSFNYYCGKLSMSEDGTKLIVGKYEFDFTLSITGASMTLKINGQHRTFHKNALASSAAK